MKRTMGLLTLTAFLSVGSGCYTFVIEGDGDLTPDSPYGSETVHGSFYGFSWSSRDVEKCFDDAGIYRVRYHTNALFTLATVLSLGLYVPQTVEWWCQDPLEEDI